jgi:GxxExxY protein
MVHEDITGRIIDAALRVHTALGPGLLESTYTACLQHEFNLRGLHFQHQVRLAIEYRGIRLDGGYRIDFLVENCVIVELKAVEQLLPLHTAQLLSYLKLSGHQVGLLINFNVSHLRHGIRRIVNGYEDPKNSAPVSLASSVVESVGEEGDRTRN